MHRLSEAAPYRARWKPHAAARRRLAMASAIAALALFLGACGSSYDSTLLATGGAGGSGAQTCVANSNDPVLSWNPVDTTVFPGLLGYRIYYGTASGVYVQAPGAGIDVGNVATVTVTGLVRGATYYFVATAYDATDESVFSNEVCKTFL